MHLRHFIFLSAIWIGLCQGHSINNKRLLMVEPLKPNRMQIVPRDFYKRDMSLNPNHIAQVKELRHDDSLRLQFSAFNASFNLHLIPNLDLFHPNAVFHSEALGSHSLKHEDYRIYRGVAVNEENTDVRWAQEQTGVWRDHYSLESETNQGILGWARIVIHHNIDQTSHPVFEGSFSVEGDIYHIKRLSNYRMTKRSDDVDMHKAEAPDTTTMVIYRDSDTEEVQTLSKRSDAQPSNVECGMDNLLFNQKSIKLPKEFSMAIRPRSYNQLAGWNEFSGTTTFTSGVVSLDSNWNSLRPPSLQTQNLKKRASGCPTQRLINYMGAAADCTYASHYQSSSAVRTQIINDWNQASAVYERTFNISLGLINITVMDLNCPTTPSSSVLWNRDCSSSYPISDRLSDFSKWRGTLGNDGAGLWHLMTQCNTGTQVGIAWLKQLCQYKVSQQSQAGEQQYVSGTGVSSIIRDEWKVVAHEIGHGFGAIHDCTAQTCPCSGSSCECCPLSSSQCDAGGTYIMNPTSNVSTNDFSPCSISTICSDFAQLGSCLQEPGARQVATTNMCGNGIVENGEQCDTAGNDTACCDAKTCKFKSGAVCDDYNSRCCLNCQLRPSSYECRPSISNCDIAEYCTGNSSACPEDKHVDDGSSCGTDLQCASGQCTSRDQQCKQRGAGSINVTGACSLDSGNCQLSCASPMGGFGSCLLFTGNFIDGTPCGVGGSCVNGTCSSAAFGNNALNWIQQHLNIFIPVVVVVGLLLLCCMISCCCRYRRTPKQAGAEYIVTGVYPPYMQQPPQAAPYGNYYPPPNPTHNNWVDPSVYNGPSGYPGSRSTTPQRNDYEMTPPELWRAPSPAYQGSLRAPTPSSRRMNEGVL